MLHAGVLKKFGLYGLLRLAVPLLPEGANQAVIGNWTGMDLLLLCIIGNVLYAGLATIGQRKLDLLLGFSSVMHMGYVFLGIASGNLIGLSGATVLMFGHGLSIAILLAINGLIRESEETTAMDRLGGLMKKAPLVGVVFAFATFASIGLPGFANFSGETLVFFGAFKASGKSFIQGATFVGLWGVVISAVYMLRAYRNVFLGETREGTRLESPTFGQHWPLLLLTASLLIAGILPNSLLNIVKPTLQTLIR
jgi:NADH-quinone oxidoreductase subunit M